MSDRPTIIVDELLEAYFGFPFQDALRFRRVADQPVDFGRAHEARIDHDVRLERSQPRDLEGDPHEVAHAMRPARRDHVIVGLVLLEHQPHRAHVVAGKAPIAMGVEISEAQLLRQPELDARDAVGDLARHELLASRAASCE